MTRLLHNIGDSPSDEPRVASNYNALAEIAACEDHLTFDGVYLSVWENREVLRGKEFTLFPMGEYMGGPNGFDIGMPREWFCNQSQIEDLIRLGGKIGWHTQTHPNLVEIDLDDAMLEMAMPEWMFEMGCEDFAYPYGEYNDRLKQLADDLGYKRAWSVTQGDGSQFALQRSYL